MSKVRNLTPEEHKALTVLNKRANEFGFKIYYYNKNGLKNAVRPWRISRRNSDFFFRFFETFERLEKYIERLIFENIEIDKMNTMFKVYGSKAYIRVIHRGNMPAYIFSPDPSANVMKAGPMDVGVYSSQRGPRKSMMWQSNETRYTDWSRIVQAYHTETARAQKVAEANT